MDKTGMKLLIFFVDVMNSKRKGKEKLSHVVQIHFWPFDVNVTQNLLLLTQESGERERRELKT